MAWTARLVAAATLVALAAAGISAQERLTVTRAVQDALLHNASLRAARAAVAETAEQESAAHAAWFPRLSVAESWQRSNQPVFVFSSLLSSRQFTASNFAIDALNHPDPIGFFHTSVGLDEVVFDYGRRPAIDAAALQREIAGFAVDETAATVALTTTQTFARVLTSEAGRRAADADLRAAIEDHARAGRRRDAGLATEADVLALAAHVADLRQRVIQAEGETAIARAELNRLMGAPLDWSYEIAEPVELVRRDASTESLEALLTEADTARPELRRAAAAERLAEAGRSRARGALVPQVAAQAALDVSGTQFNDRTSAWLVGGVLRWNFSLGGAEVAQARAAAQASARAKAETEDARAAVHVEVVTALRRLETARARQTVARAAVDQARESQRIIRDRYESGMAGVTDVLRASGAVLDAENQRVSTVVDAMVAEAMLRRSVGRQP